MYFSWMSGMLSFLILFALEHKAVIGKGFFLTLKVNLWRAPCLSCPLACPAGESSRTAALNGSREAKMTWVFLLYWRNILLSGWHWLVNPPFSVYTLCISPWHATPSTWSQLKGSSQLRKKPSLLPSGLLWPQNVAFWHQGMLKWSSWNGLYTQTHVYKHIYMAVLTN